MEAIANIAPEGFTLPLWFARLVEHSDQERAEWRHLMSTPPHDGRPSMNRNVARIGVANAQETRAARRWKRSSSRPGECMRSFDGGVTWQPMPTPEKEHKTTKRTTKRDAASDYAARVALVGATGDVS